MIASLPMYDWPEVRDATDRFWDGLRRNIGAEIPLWRGENHLLPWRSPDLLFSQTCGYPLTHEFQGKLNYVATPHYAVDGCEGADYYSMVFARAKADPADFRGCKAAINARDSMSGMLALKLVFAPFATQGPFFSQTAVTGSHIASLQAVQRGDADVCAIDAVCVALARRYRPMLLEGLVEIARSPQVPGLPFVTTAGNVEALQESLRLAFDDPALAEARERLFLVAYSILDLNRYNRIIQLESAMEKAGGVML